MHGLNIIIDRNIEAQARAEAHAERDRNEALAHRIYDAAAGLDVREQAVYWLEYHRAYRQEK